MGPVNAERAIDVPREAAFAFLADLANRPAFTDHFVSDFHLLREESTGVGAGARFRFFAPPQAIWMDTTIVELERPLRISERGNGGRFNRIPSATEWELVAGPGPLTTVRVTYWTEPAHPMDRMKEVLGGASIWYGRDWAQALRRLRELLEQDGGGDRQGIGAGSGYSTPMHQ
jgi:Polyketide cyclase / dehydrase and lipid transport